MSEKLNVNVRQSKTGYEGTVQVPGLKATKIARKDGSTSFPSSSALKTVARSVAKRLSLEVNYEEAATKKLAAKPTAKKTAAAKAPKAKVAKPAKAKASKPACPNTSAPANS